MGSARAQHEEKEHSANQERLNVEFCAGRCGKASECEEWLCRPSVGRITQICMPRVMISPRMLSMSVMSDVYHFLVAEHPNCSKNWSQHLKAIMGRKDEQMLPVGILRHCSAGNAQHCLLGRLRVALHGAA